MLGNNFKEYLEFWRKVKAKAKSRIWEKMNVTPKRNYQALENTSSKDKFPFVCFFLFSLMFYYFNSKNGVTISVMFHFDHHHPDFKYNCVIRPAISHSVTFWPKYSNGFDHQIPLQTLNNWHLLIGIPSKTFESLCHMEFSNASDESPNEHPGFLVCGPR